MIQEIKKVKDQEQVEITWQLSTEKEYLSKEDLINKIKFKEQVIADVELNLEEEKDTLSKYQLALELL